jgi:hypothetical protein
MRLLTATALVPLVILAAILLPAGSAQARSCPATSSSSLQVHGVSCAAAVAILGKARPHLAEGDHHFPVYFRGRRWGCSETSIGGIATVTCERGYGTPRRQYLIFLSE